MLDYRDIVDFVLTVFHKKKMEPISEDEAIGISDIVHRATAGETIPTEAIVGKFRSSFHHICRLVSTKPVLLRDGTLIIAFCD